MTLEDIMNEQKEDKKILDNLGIFYLNNEDIIVCDYVSKQLSSVDYSDTKINVGRNISFNELINNSINELSVFEGSLIYEILNILDNVSIRITDDNFGFGTAIRYGVDEVTNRIEHYGKVKSYVIPNNLYEISSIFFSHEYIHSLKDTIYCEYVYNKTLGETIPLFYELISCADNDNLRDEMIKIRLSFLLDNNKEYCLFSDLITGKKLDNNFSNIRFNLEEKELYSFLRSKVGCYLNSFYYAVILYSLYKVNPKKILNLVSMVLKKNITTFDLLNSLDIYGDVRGQVFEKELDIVKRKIK